MKLLSVLICLVLTGCHEPGRVVEGTFVVDGKPKSGVEVRLPNNLEDFSNCGSAPLAAVTDRSGKFTASTAKFPIRPCFTVDGKIYSDFIVVDDGQQDPIILRCELPLTVTGHFEDGHVCYCRQRGLTVRSTRTRFVPPTTWQVELAMLSAPLCRSG